MYTGSTRPIKRFFTLFLLIAMVALAVVFAGGVSPLRAYAQTEDDLTVVRVGYPIMKNFEEGGDGEKKSGYGYEYLQKIAYYAGWKYEYVYGTFQELLEELEAGDIDLMAGISYTSERAELIDYAERTMGEEWFYIFSRVDQDFLISSEPDTFKGCRIGVHTGCYAISLLEDWCRENHLDCEIVEYEDTEECLSALVDGKLDAIADSEIYINHECMPLVYLGQDEYSFCVSKERPDLLTQLNQAMNRIKSSNFFYEYELRTKYLSYDANVALPLSAEEETWLEQNPKIRVGYLDTLMPYCEEDDSSGEAQGMLVDLMENISDIYNMNFQLVSYPGYEQMSQALSEGEVDAIFPVYGEYYVGEAEQMLISDPVTVSTMTLLNNRSGTEGDQVAAVTGSSPFQHYVLQDYYPDTELVYYDSIADCIQAVIDGKADFTMMETAIKNERVETSYRKSIQTVELPIDVNISFGVKIGNRQLLAILNKSICMEQSQIVTSLIQHSQTHMTYTARDFVRDHMGMVLSVMVLVFVVILGMLFAYFRMRLQGERKLLESEQGRREAQWSAQHDGLTGLLNRSAFQEVCRHLAHSSEPLALMLVDVDDFKKVNDTYGHEVGDQALAKVGTLLGLFFRDEDFVIRYGGDEFLVLAINTGSEEAVNLEQKIRSINDILQKPEQFIPKLSISAGIAFSPSGYRDALFNQADRALDRVKASGRCGSCIYQNK